MRARVVWGVCFLTLVAIPARGQTSGQAGLVFPDTWRLSVGTTAGGMVLDDHLADYRWDTRARAQWGAHVSLLRGRYAAGVRLWRAQTTQASGVPGESDPLEVRLTSIELTGRVRLLGYGGFGFWAGAHGGRLHMGYDPDRLTLDAGVTAEPITVRFAPIDEWLYGSGLVVTRGLTRHAVASVSAEVSSFRLDTAHRRGSEIVELRERFYAWSLRLEVAWHVSLR